EQREGVADAPADAEEGSSNAVAFAGHECRHGRKVIGFERVTHPEQRAEAGRGQELENWHKRVRRSYVNLLLRRRARIRCAATVGTVGSSSARDVFPARTSVENCRRLSAVRIDRWCVATMVHA